MTDVVNLCCRLCHRKASADSPNIFQRSMDLCPGSAIAEILKDLWDIHYQPHDLLPDLVCTKCLELLANEFELRKDMQEREQRLQEQLKEALQTHPTYRHDLNGNPGEDVPNPGVDPKKLDRGYVKSVLGSSSSSSSSASSREEEKDQSGRDMMDMPLGTAATQMPLLEVGMGAANVNATEEVEDQSGKDMTDMSVGTAAAPMPLLEVGMEATKANATRGFLCQYCDMGFAVSAECQQHERSGHDPAAPYRCDFCLIRMKSSRALISHIKAQHDAERPFVCAQCGIRFGQRSDRKKHMNVHTGVRPFTCGLCSKSFTRNANLKKHMRIHSGRKPFVCQHCSRCFRTNEELQKHSLTHTVVKAFKCGRCPISFSRRDKLLCHQGVHIKRDAALQRGQWGYLSTQLDVDLAPKGVQPTHHHLRNFRCDICGRTYQRQGDMRRHRSLHLVEPQMPTMEQGHNKESAPEE